MEKKKAVFLFGAGAVLDWGAPSTSHLTELIRTSGYKIKGGEVTVTEFLYSKLRENDYSEKEINFETILNAIEELIVYYSSNNSEVKQPSILKCLFDCNFEDKIFDFSIKGGEEKNGYSIEVPSGNKNFISQNSYSKETPQQFFLLHLMQELLSVISNEVIEYAYHGKEHSKVKLDSQHSYNFTRWMSHIEKDHILRLYTLNYDRIFKILLEREGIEVFEGFEAREYVPYNISIKSEIPKILSDSKSNVHYNLHGSIHWEVLDTYNGFKSPDIFLTTGGHLQLNDMALFEQIEKGKATILSNIITGYHKVQKSILSPFRQMYSSFDRDCILSDRIYIVGYSFGDEHINQILKTVLRCNKNFQIVIIDPDFFNNRMDRYLYMNILPHYKGPWSLPISDVTSNYFKYLDGKIKVHTLKFNEFLRF